MFLLLNISGLLKIRIHVLPLFCAIIKELRKKFFDKGIVRAIFEGS